MDIEQIPVILSKFLYHYQHQTDLRKLKNCLDKLIVLPQIHVMVDSMSNGLVSLMAQKLLFFIVF